MCVCVGVCVGGALVRGRGGIVCVCAGPGAGLYPAFSLDLQLITDMFKNQWTVCVSPPFSWLIMGFLDSQPAARLHMTAVMVSLCQTIDPLGTSCTGIVICCTMTEGSAREGLIGSLKKKIICLFAQFCIHPCM